MTENLPQPRGFVKYNIAPGGQAGTNRRRRGERNRNATGVRMRDMPFRAATVKAAIGV